MWLKNGGIKFKNFKLWIKYQRKQFNTVIARKPTQNRQLIAIRCFIKNKSAWKDIKRVKRRNWETNDVDFENSIK